MVGSKLPTYCSLQDTNVSYPDYSLTNSNSMIFANSFRMIFVGVSFVICTLTYAASDYPNTEWMGGKADKNSDWYKQCIAAKDVQPPKADLPSDQAASALGGCDATDLYYEAKGKSRPNKSDWQKVKNCAFVVNDDAVLMMLYANGFGVTRNARLAIKYACKVGGAPAEVESRIPHLAGAVDGDKVFDLCDDISSGYMQGMCASISESRIEKARTARIAEIRKNWTRPQNEAFDKVQSTLNEFVTQRGPEETDQLGSGRAAFVTETIAGEMDHFLSDLENFEKGNTPRFTTEQFVELDKKLNQIYQEIMHSKSRVEGSRLGYSTITKEGVKNTQRAWLKYRDAWVGFGRIKWSSVDAQSWKAHLTEQRIEELEGVQVYAKE